MIHESLARKGKTLLVFLSYAKAVLAEIVRTAVISCSVSQRRADKNASFFLGQRQFFCIRLATARSSPSKVSSNMGKILAMTPMVLVTGHRWGGVGFSQTL